jgi:hypothetical protein
MQTSLDIAMLLGPAFILFGLFILIWPQAYRDWLYALVERPPTRYLAGFLALLGGMALVFAHNVWVFDWRLLITLIGWSLLLKGAVILAAPGAIRLPIMFLIALRIAFVATAAVVLVIGLVLSGFGYLA